MTLTPGYVLITSTLFRPICHQARPNQTETPAESKNWSWSRSLARKWWPAWPGCPPHFRSSSSRFRSSWTLKKPSSKATARLIRSSSVEIYCRTKKTRRNYPGQVFTWLNRLATTVLPLSYLTISPETWLPSTQGVGSYKTFFDRNLQMFVKS